MDNHFARWESGQELSHNLVDTLRLRSGFNVDANEKCVVKSRHYEGSINDLPCQRTIKFLCQRRPELFTDCGGTYSNPSGILTSPSYPNHYPELANCVYLISEPYGTYVNVSILSLDIDCHDESSASDFIEMRDGQADESPLMAKFCGNGSNVPKFMHTSQNYLRIR